MADITKTKKYKFAVLFIEAAKYFYLLVAIGTIVTNWLILLGNKISWLPFVNRNLGQFAAWGMITFFFVMRADTSHIKFLNEINDSLFKIIDQALKVSEKNEYKGKGN